MKQINRVPRIIVLGLLAALAVAVATPRAAAQAATNLPRTVPGTDEPRQPFQRRLAAMMADQAMATAPDEAQQAWANIGPPGKDIEINGMPLVEVVRILLHQFSNQFDVILPSKGGAKDTTIDLQLKNVRPVDVFNAMNMSFEIDGTPLHWKLVLNGDRPTAVLQIMDAGVTHQAPTQSTVYYIGDLLRDSAGIGFDKDALFDAIRQVHNDTAPATAPDKVPRLAFHPEAGLLVVTGTLEQISLTMQTLGALHSKVNHDRMGMPINGPIQSAGGGMPVPMTHPALPSPQAPPPAAPTPPLK
jgi:hypothetical protein